MCSTVTLENVRFLCKLSQNSDEIWPGFYADDPKMRQS